MKPTKCPAKEKKWEKKSESEYFASASEGRKVRDL